MKSQLLSQMDQRTYASVTAIACERGYLQRSADDPDVPIEFDQETNEFHFSYGGATLIIYHCPYCGGAARKSKRSLLFAAISSEEQERLTDLLRPVRSIRSALRRLGESERDDPGGLWVMRHEKDGQAPTRQRYRTLTYERLSEVADVSIAERADGSIHWHLIGKALNHPNKLDG